MFKTIRVNCPVCGNHAEVQQHYTERVVFGSCDKCGTLGAGMKNGLIEHRRWVDLPDW